MNKILSLGRWLFPLSFLMYAGLHFGKPDVGAAMVPNYLTFPYFWNYFTAVCMLSFVVSALISKYNKLAYTLMAVYVLRMALLVHLPHAMGHQLSSAPSMTGDLARGREPEMVNVFRNILVVGALLGFARSVAKDKRIIG